MKTDILFYISSTDIWMNNKYETIEFYNIDTKTQSNPLKQEF